MNSFTKFEYYITYFCYNIEFLKWSQSESIVTYFAVSVTFNLYILIFKSSMSL